MDELTVTIDSLAYGIFGVARTDGGVVFVPGVAPGEVARVRIIDHKRDYREAELVEIIEPSPSRRVPPCPYVPECGGCAWQHLGYSAQLEAKEAILRQTLARIGGFDATALEVRKILASPQWAYRHRLTLRVDGEQRLGFYQHRSHRLVEIARCQIADEPVNAHLEVARRWLRGVSTTVRRVEIASTRDRHVVLVGNAEGAFRHDDVYHERFLRAYPTVTGILLFGKGWRRAFGKPVVDLEVDGDLVLESQGGFTQVNPDGNRRLVETVLDLAAPNEQDRVLDLYCGAGNFTLPLARRAREVLGVDADPASIIQARRNADRARLRNCRFMEQGSAAAARGFAASRDRFSLVVLDPPRSGAADVVEHLGELASNRLLYVSCNPATLARDLRRLTRLGFTLGPVQPLDLFPQTYHIEAVVRLDRDGATAPLPVAGSR